MAEKNTPPTIDAYIAGFAPDIQDLLQQVRNTIRRAAPDAVEAISYAIPTFKLEGNLVHFAAFKDHIGFYATPSASGPFREELEKYEIGKGSIKFPLSRPIPFELIDKIVRFRVQENLERAANKRAAKKK